MLNTIIAFIFIIFALFTIGYFIALYNSLVSIRNNVSKAWANIDVLLRQRHDELPKLIDTCKHYMNYEQETFKSIIEARNQIDTALKSQDLQILGKAESSMQANLKNLFALAENYPELKTNNSFIQLQTRISELEKSISERREFYNENVALNNTRVEQFPTDIIAKIFHFKHCALLQIADADKTDIDINSAFKQ